MPPPPGRPPMPPPGIPVTGTPAQRQSGQTITMPATPPPTAAPTPAPAPAPAPAAKASPPPAAMPELTPPGVAPKSEYEGLINPALKFSDLPPIKGLKAPDPQPHVRGPGPSPGQPRLRDLVWTANELGVSDIHVGVNEAAAFPQAG